MAARKDRERADVAKFLPANTRHLIADGKDIWIFQKQTEVEVLFEIALYYDPDERGYCAQLISPELEDAWKTPHIGHLFSDGVICFGGQEMRTRETLREAFAKSCLWAEGIALMLVAKRNGTPTEFPFSNNNSSPEVQSGFG